MPAAIVKGIIVSVSIVAALGIAVLENPQVQVWLEEQRKKLVELLKHIGEELDPASRRAAEAFAYEGRTPANDDGLLRERSGSEEAAAIATGRTLSNLSTIRRIPISGPTDPDAAEERKRKGEQYLAQREMQMIELQRRKSTKETSATPTSPTFDSFIDGEGRLKDGSDLLKDLPSPPAMEMVDAVPMNEAETTSKQKMVAEGSNSNTSAFQMGSQMANPFGDEFELDRSMTPRPPIPPKVKFDLTEHEVPAIPGSFSPPASPPQEQHQSNAEHEDEPLTFEEQLAIALSLSESESAAKTMAARQTERDDDSELLAAIAASLKEMDSKKPIELVQLTGAMTPRAKSQQLVDISPGEPNNLSPVRARGNWETIFEQEFSPSQKSINKPLPSVTSEDTDELYSVTPQLTKARLAILESQQGALSSSGSSIPYDPVRDAVSRQAQTPQPALDASFYSAPESIEAPSTSPGNGKILRVVNVTDDDNVEGTRTPIAKDDQSSFGFHTDTESSQGQSRPESVMSGAQVVEAVEDSDPDVLSEDEEGILTPDSWTEVGSDDEEESEADGIERHLEATL